MAEKNTGKWVKVEEILQQADKKELVELIRVLYGRSTGDRMLINARCLGEMMEKKRAKMLKGYRKTITEEFAPDREKIRFSVLERAINDYSNEAGDLVGTMELMLTYVESGVQYASIFGAMDDEFSDCVEWMLERFGELLKTEEGQKYYKDFNERLFKISQDSDGISWGFGEMISELVGEIEEFFGEDTSDSE